MLPLSIFIVIWLVFLGIFGLLSLASVVQMVRFGVSGSITYISTGIFLVVSALVIFTIGMYLLTVDWSSGFDIGGIFSFPAAL